MQGSVDTSQVVGYGAGVVGEREHPAERYVRLRKAKDPTYSQSQLARDAGMSPQYLNDIIHKRSRCSATAARQLVQGSGHTISYADLLEWEAA